MFIMFIYITLNVIFYDQIKNNIFIFILLESHIMSKNYDFKQKDVTFILEELILRMSYRDCAFANRLIVNFFFK
jgi:hypothetical protein